MITKEEYTKEYNEICDYWSNWLLEQIKKSNNDIDVIKNVCSVAISGSNKDMFELLNKL